MRNKIALIFETYQDGAYLADFLLKKYKVIGITEIIKSNLFRLKT